MTTESTCDASGGHCHADNEGRCTTLGHGLVDLARRFDRRENGSLLNLLVGMAVGSTLVLEADDDLALASGLILRDLAALALRTDWGTLDTALSAALRSLAHQYPQYGTPAG